MTFLDMLTVVNNCSYAGAITKSQQINNLLHFTMSESGSAVPPAIASALLLADGSVVLSYMHNGQIYMENFSEVSYRSFAFGLAVWFG